MDKQPRTVSEKDATEYYEKEKQLASLSSRFNQKDQFALWSMCSYVTFVNKERSPVERMVDEATGYLWITYEDALDYMEWIYDWENIPVYMSEFLKLLLEPKKKGLSWNAIPSQ